MFSNPVRSIVVWVPDWPVVAYAYDAGMRPESVESEPIAVFDKGAVRSCSAAARREGVRVGQRRRDAQSRCPQLVVVAADHARDARVFAPLVASIEERSPGVQLREPGLCVLAAKGPSRYYGGEERAAAALLAALSEVDDVRLGVADDPFTAEVAARFGTRAARGVSVIASGASSAFLSPFPVTVLDDITGESLADFFARLGVQNLGEVASIAPARLRERFGERGARLHALVSGGDLQPIVPREPPPELHREVSFEPAVHLAEQIAFGMRVAAEEFITGLGAIDLVCTELRVEIEGERGERSDRVWLHPGFFDAAAVVDRVRWQLSEGGLASGVTRVRIEPDGVDDAAHHVRTLFGSGAEERMHHALSRVQALLGHRGVVTPEIGGGRVLAERQVWVPWGDRRVVTKERARPWPGSLPDPLPSVVFDENVPVAVIDSDGDMVSVTGRGEFTGVPATLVAADRARRVASWAGPWPVNERGWDPERSRRAHRCQIIDVTQTAWLVICENGDWRVEGRYD